MRRKICTTNADTRANRQLQRTPRELVGFVKVDVKLGKKLIWNTRIVITKDGQRSLTGQDWLANLGFELAEAAKHSEYTINIIQQQKMNLDEIVMEIAKKFFDLFKRQEK